MSFFEKWETAINNKDLDAMVALMHPERTMVMHSTGKVVVSEKLIRSDVRCTYENDGIMVSHAIVTFPNGSTDALMYAGILKDGKLFRTETGSTPLKD